MRLPFLAEPTSQEDMPRDDGARLTGNQQWLERDAAIRDRLIAAKATNLPTVDFIEHTAQDYIPPEEAKALYERGMKEGSKDPVSFDQNLDWLSDLAASDNDKAGMAAKRILGTMRKYLGDDGMYGKPTQAP